MVVGITMSAQQKRAPIPSMIEKLGTMLKTLRDRQRRHQLTSEPETIPKLGARVGSAPPSGATPPYPPLMPSHTPKPGGCTAAFRRGARPCKNKAAPGFDYCTAHLSLLQPAQWIATGYAARLEPAERAVFRSAVVPNMADELGLTRIQVLRLLDREASPEKVIRALLAVATLGKLQHRIRQLTLGARPTSRRRKRRPTQAPEA